LTLYVDSNIFIFAATDKGALGRDCRAFIGLLSEKKVNCAASYLVVDEVMWVLRKNVGKGNAVRIAKALLSLPVKWVEVDRAVMIRMLEVCESTALDPRDAIHVSSMRKAGLSRILSEDRDFDGLEGVERMSVSEFVHRQA